METLKAITEANPDDSQSLEILKDAYWRLEDHCAGLVVTRKLADAYLRLGQYSSALLEYEGILLHEPENAEVRALLTDLESKLNRGNAAGKSAPIALDFGLVEISEPASESATPSSSSTPDPSLIATNETRMPANVVRKPVTVSMEQDGNEPLARFLIQHRLAKREIVESALLRVRELNAAFKADPSTQPIAAGLLDEVIQAGVEAEPLLAAIIDRTKYAFAPLDCYDIDRQIVKMLPQELTLGRRVVAFDIVSRTMMVALDNPFDLAVKTAVQQAVDYHVQWHLALPGVVQHILRDSYRLAN